MKYIALSISIIALIFSISVNESINKRLAKHEPEGDILHNINFEEIEPPEAYSYCFSFDIEGIPNFKEDNSEALLKANQRHVDEIFSIVDKYMEESK